jgi:hypothetical protein
MLTRIEIDVSTGIESIIELTPEEINELEEMKIAFEARTEKAKNEEEARDAAKKSAQEKLLSLGLTSEEIAALSN